eukprot:2511344-Karenia_brevis.AAC.1
MRRIAFDVCAKPDNNKREAWAASRAVRQMDAQLPCPSCGAVFGSKQALAVHQYKEHGVTRELRRFIDGVQCVACLQHFHTRERLVCHLAEKSARCRQIYYMCVSPMSDDQFKALEDEGRSVVAKLQRSGWKRHKAEDPVLRAEGPLRLQCEMACIRHSNLLRGAW